MAKTPGIHTGVGQEQIFLDSKQATTQELIAHILGVNIPPVLSPAAPVLSWLKYCTFEAGTTPYLVTKLFNDYLGWWGTQSESKHFDAITLKQFSEILGSKFQKGRRNNGICYYLRKSTDEVITPKVKKKKKKKKKKLK